MKDEIKEILDDMNYRPERAFIISADEKHLLLDYITNLQNENMKYDQCLTELTDDYKNIQKEITNLQEENERLKEIVENLTTMTASGDGKQIKNTAQFKLDICKQRIDKAIEYGNNCLENIEDYDEYVCESIDIVGLLRMIHKNYIDILQGSDE